MANPNDWAEQRISGGDYTDLMRRINALEDDWAGVVEDTSIREQYDYFAGSTGGAMRFLYDGGSYGYFVTIWDDNTNGYCSCWDKSDGSESWKYTLGTVANGFEPRSLCVDDSDNIYIYVNGPIAGSDDRLIVLDEDGNKLRDFGAPPTPDPDDVGIYSIPCMAWNPNDGYLYLYRYAAVGGSDILVYSTTGTYIRQHNSVQPSGFNAGGMACDSAGRIWYHGGGRYLYGYNTSPSFSYIGSSNFQREGIMAQVYGCENDAATLSMHYDRANGMMCVAAEYAFSEAETGYGLFEIFPATGKVRWFALFPDTSYAAVTGMDVDPSGDDPVWYCVTPAWDGEAVGDPDYWIRALTRDSQTESRYYDGATTHSFGTPDGGVSIPALDGIDGEPIVPYALIQIRDAIEELSNHVGDPSEDDVLSMQQTSAGYANLLELAVPDRSVYGATGSATRRSWTVSSGNLPGNPIYDIDIGEVADCVDYIEDATA